MYISVLSSFSSDRRAYQEGEELGEQVNHPQASNMNPNSSIPAWMLPHSAE